MLPTHNLRGAIVRHFDRIGVIIGVSERGYEVAEVLEPKRGHFGRHRADVAHDEFLLPTGSVIRCCLAEPIPSTASVAGRLSEIAFARVLRALAQEARTTAWEASFGGAIIRESAVRF